MLVGNAADTVIALGDLNRIRRGGPTVRDAAAGIGSGARLRSCSKQAHGPAHATAKTAPAPGQCLSRVTHKSCGFPDREL